MCLQLRQRTSVATHQHHPEVAVCNIKHNLTHIVRLQEQARSLDAFALQQAGAPVAQEVQAWVEQDHIWCAANAEISTMVEKASVGNLKQTWTSRGLYYDLADKQLFEGPYFLARATQVKNVWIPYGA